MQGPARRLSDDSVNTQLDSQHDLAQFALHSLNP